MALFPTLFSVGLAADLQHCDTEDGFSYVDKVPRRYRQTLRTLEQAVSVFEAAGTHINILLGDQIDCKCATLGQTELALQRVLHETSKTRAAWLMCHGNHDISCLSRERILQTYVPPQAAQFNTASPTTPQNLYWAFIPFTGFRFLFFDPFDVSTVNASSLDHEQKADEILKRNPNLEGERRMGSWFEGLAAHELRFVPFNGGMGEQQLLWLRSQLQLAESLEEKVFVFCHLPIYERACNPAGLLWNAEEVLQLLQASPSVKACFSGHDHQGGYAIDSFGIHHVVPSAPLECGENEPAFGVLKFSSELAVVSWTGKVPPVSSDPWPSVLVYRCPDLAGAYNNHNLFTHNVPQ